MKNNHVQKNSGFTLIELLLAIGITSILLLLLVFFTQNILEVQTKQRTIREVSEQGELIMDTLLTSIHNATDVLVPADGSTSDTLELTFSESAFSPAEIYVMDGIVFKEENNGPALPLHNDRVIVTELSFSHVAYDEAWDTIDITLRLEYNSPSPRYEYQYTKSWQGTMVMRNYVR